MHDSQERTANRTAYRRMKDKLVQTYGSGRFVAIANGQVIAEADTFTHMRDQLRLSGHDPAQILIVQAGVDYPETAVIFSASGIVSAPSNGSHSER